MHHRSLLLTQRSPSCERVVVAFSVIAAICGWLCLTSFACRSNPVVIAGPDTTSHAFTWEVTTLGGTGGSSGLYDVAIINDTLAYAVGEIYVAGETDIYNLSKWDGKTWNLKRVSVQFRGFTIIPPLEGIFAFSASEMWLVGSLPIFGDGNNWQIFDLRTTVDPNLSLIKAWGRRSNDMFFVGRNGSIAHYDGTSWRKIESGTTTHITDVYGSGSVVLATVTDEYSNGDRRLLQLHADGRVDTLSWAPRSRLQSLWFNTIDRVFVGGGKLVVGNPNTWQEVLDLPAYYSKRIRGNASNDVFVVGAFGLFGHYNGQTWHYYSELYNSNESLYAVACKGNVVIAAGQRGSQAVVVQGKRF